MYEFKHVQRNMSIVYYIYIQHRDAITNLTKYIFTKVPHIFISPRQQGETAPKTDAENIVIKVGWKMQQHGSLKIYKSLSKVKMLVVSQKYQLTKKTKGNRTL